MRPKIDSSEKTGKKKQKVVITNLFDWRRPLKFNIDDVQGLMKGGKFYDELIFSEDIHHKHLYYFCIGGNHQQRFINQSLKFKRCFQEYFVGQRYPNQIDIIDAEFE